MQKISCIVHNLASNPIVRAYPIIEALKRLNFEVEVLGLLINNSEIYRPYAEKYFYKSIVYKNPDLCTIHSISKQLSKMVEGDIVYSFKPLWTTFYPSLLASKFGRGKKLILDIDDHELWYYGMGNGIKHLKYNKFDILNPFYNKLLHPLTSFAKVKTVVSKYLQKKYGGTIIQHGPNEMLFNPDLYSPENVKDNFNLPKNRKLALFAGSPQTYKGFNLLIEIFQSSPMKNWLLILAGNSENMQFQNAKKKLKDKCILLGNISNSLMPALLSAIDCVPILQLPSKATYAQMPAKLFEAMAMKKSIIGTFVSDIPEVLQNNVSGHCGWLVEHNNINNIIKAFLEIENNEDLAKKYGENARSYFMENCSIQAIAKKLMPILLK